MTNWAGSETAPLTIRLEADRTIVSTDDGLTVVGGPEPGAAVRGAIARLLENGTMELPSATARSIFAEAGQIRPAPRVRPASAGWPRNELMESIAVGPLAYPLEMPLQDVLLARRSERILGDVDLRDVATVLVHSARVRDFRPPDTYGFQETFGSIPTAGARAPLEFILLAREVVELEPGLWAFDPFRCVLNPLVGDTKKELAATLLGDLLRAPPPPAAIFVVVDFERTLSRYPAGSTLAWRDAGAALATLHLCAAAAGLGSCIVGSAGLIKQPTGDTFAADVGALAMGGKTS
jgi:SagB-type dehydrogenase family enzyme